MRLFNLFLAIMICVCFSVSLAMAECTLTMVYKEGDKLPLIAETPDNSGGYYDLFSQAAERIGCKLKVVRLPKKRVHQELKDGTVDFYPAASFSEERSTYLYYIENGMITGEYGITASKLPDIINYTMVKKMGLFWLMELGSSKVELAKSLNIERMEVDYADIEKAKELINNGRDIFYVADKELVDYFLVEKKISSFQDIGLKAHYNCCGGEYPMYMAFSRFSPHFKEKSNPDFDPSKKVSQTNSKTTILPECTAYKFAKALQDLKQEGITASIYQKYFGISPTTKIAQSAGPKDVETIIEEEKEYVLSLKGRELLFEGLEGKQVKDLQHILHKKQFYSGPVDGKFTANLTKSVLAFQKSENIIVDGLVGPQTWRKLIQE